MIAWWLLILGAVEAEAACEPIGFRDIVQVEAPAVIVLGERHGHAPDLPRAARVVRHLQQHGQVTLALEAVHERYQPVLHRYAAGEVDPERLPDKLEWESSWGFPWQPYERLVTAARLGVHVVAAGLDLRAPPERSEVPVPAGYVNILRDAMAGHSIAPGMEHGFVQAMAWRDHGIASRAVEGWDGEGYLVVLTGRGHVEGGLGVQWQIERMVDVPVHAFVLAWGTDPPCYPGDKVWRRGIFG